jgi:hypothetical protein
MTKVYQSSIKQSTQKRYKKEQCMSKQNEETSKGWPTRGTSTNHVLKTLPPHLQGAYQIMRMKEHLKEHLA